MTIVEDSRRVLKAMYNLITEDSYSLVVEFKIADICNTVNMTNEHLSLCIHYLVLGGFLTGDISYNTQDGAKKKLTFTTLGINRVENVTL